MALQGYYLIPDVNFLATPPFFVRKEDRYVYFYRLHLAQDIDVDYDEENRLLKFDIVSTSSLLPNECDNTP